MMTKNCKECSNEALDKYADLYLKYERLQREVDILNECLDVLNECLDVKDKLLNLYRQKNEELITQLKIYKKD